MPTPLRLLIADDQPTSRQGLRAIFSTVPEVEIVAEAQDGEGALRLAAITHPNIVLTDVRMPGMDGLEATRRIKAAYPTIRIVVLSLYPSYRGSALNAGADAFLVKGCQAQVLINTVLDRNVD